MSQPLSNLFLSIGRPVKDEYGRSVGRIISFATNPSGKFEAAFIELSDGRFTKQPMEALVFNGADITFTSKIKSKAAIFCDQIPFIWRKDQALKDLSEKKKISTEMYMEIHNSFDGVLNQLKKDAQVLSEEISDEIATCDDEIRAMSYALLNLEIEHEIGKIEEEAYKTSFAMLQENLKRTTQEKSELELARTKLSNTLLGDLLGPVQKTRATVDMSVDLKHELPEPPVVVYVKEIGKAGI